MGFAQYSHQTIGGKSGGTMGTFFSFQVRPEEKAPDAAINFGGKSVYGNYEVVWFLNSLPNSPAIWYHDTNTRDSILCAKTFPESGGQCPACDEFERIKPMYEGTGWKGLPIYWAQQQLVIPVYVPRRAREKHIYKGRLEILPIYWMYLKIDNKENASFQRLQTANGEGHLMTTNPFVVLKEPKVQGKKQQWWFMPTNYDPSTMGVYIDHPLLKPPYLNPENPGQKGWDENYHNIMELLPLLGFKQYVDSNTQQPFEYFGYYARAMQYHNWCKDNWPPASVPVAAQPVQNFGAPPQAFQPAQASPF